MFALQTFLLRLWEWLTFINTRRPLPQISQRRDISTFLYILIVGFWFYLQHFVVLDDPFTQVKTLPNPCRGNRIITNFFQKTSLFVERSA